MDDAEPLLKWRMAVVRVSGAPPSTPISRGYFCVKGLASIELAYHEARLKHPLKRESERGGRWVRVS